jgi:hypothetical protein
MCKVFQVCYLKNEEGYTKWIDVDEGAWNSWPPTLRRVLYSEQQATLQSANQKEDEMNDGGTCADRCDYPNCTKTGCIERERMRRSTPPATEESRCPECEGINEHHHTDCPFYFTDTPQTVSLPVDWKEQIENMTDLKGMNKDEKRGFDWAIGLIQSLSEQAQQATAPDNENHFMKCGICQQPFDMRDLGQVFEHEHKHLPKGFAPVEKVMELVEYLRSTEDSSNTVDEKTEAFYEQYS